MDHPPTNVNNQHFKCREMSWDICLPLRNDALNSYMAAGRADSADGETVCSRSGVWPSAWPCMSVGASRRSERGSRGAEKSPVGDSQDRSPLLAYSSSIWVVVRLRAWGTKIVWLNTQLTHKLMDQLVIITSPMNNYYRGEQSCTFRKQNRTANRLHHGFVYN